MAELFSNLLRQAGIWSSSREEYATEKMERLSKLLQMYSPNYYLVNKPEGVRSDAGTAYYAIIEHHPGGQPQVIRWITDPALENPQALIDWLAAGDTNRHDAKEILARMDAELELQEAEKERAQREKYAAEDEVTATILRGGHSRLHEFKHDGVKYASNVI